MVERIPAEQDKNDELPPQELPVTWFKAIKDGNAFFPFSSTGVSTFLLDVLFKEKNSFEEIEEITKIKYVASDAQRDEFMTSMHEFHAAYATPIAGEGKAKELQEDIHARHGQRSPVEALDLSRKGFERFMEGIILAPEIVLDQFSRHVGDLVSSEQELYTIVKTYIGHAAHILRHDKEVRKVMKVYMEEHRAFSLSPDIVDQERDLDSRINAARYEVTKTIISKIVEAVSKDPVFADRDPDKRERLIEALCLAYGRAHRRPKTPGILL